PAARVGRTRLDCGAGLVQALARRLGLSVHVGQHRLDHLEFRDRPPELPALPGIACCDVERALRNPDRLGGDPGSAPIQRPHGKLESLTDVPDAVRVRDAYAAKPELRGRRAADPHLVLDALDAEARRLLPDDEAG